MEKKMRILKNEIKTIAEGMEKWSLGFNARENFAKYVEKLSESSYYDSKIFDLIYEIIANGNSRNQGLMPDIEGSIEEVG
ncbi:MAG: hypothetical protein LUH57_01860 [Ruminococcus sp.]|nr:hypothetical protein [Ruminococcus sp.]